LFILFTELGDNYVGISGSKNAQRLVWRVYPVPLGFSYAPTTVTTLYSE